MGCCVDTYRAAVGRFAGVLMKILSRYAAIAGRRVRGYRSQGMCAMLAVTTLLVFLLIGGVEPNPGPDKSGDNTGGHTSQSTMEDLAANVRTLMDKVGQLQSDIRTDMDRKLHDVGESIRHTVETSSQALRQDISKLQEDIDSVGEQVEENRGRIDRLEAENLLLAKGLADLGKELENLESRSRRNNVRFYGITETVGESFQACADKVVSVLNEFFPCKTWAASDVERAHRTGSGDPATHKPRPMIVRFHRWADKMRLFHDNDARTALRMAGLRFSSDLTKRQAATLKEVRADGKFGFYKNGKLHIQDDQDSQTNSGSQYQPPSSYREVEASDLPNLQSSSHTGQDDDNNARGEGLTSAFGTDIDNNTPSQQQLDSEHASTSASQRPPSPLYSEMVANGQKQGQNGARGSPSSPGNTINGSATTVNNSTGFERNDTQRGGRGTPVNRTPNAPKMTSAGVSPVFARGGGSGGRGRGGALRGSRGNTSNSRNSRPHTRLQSQSLSLPPPLRDQPRISDSWRSPAHRVSGGDGQYKGKN